MDGLRAFYQVERRDDVRRVRHALDLWNDYARQRLADVRHRRLRHREDVLARLPFGRLHGTRHNVRLRRRHDGRWGLRHLGRHRTRHVAGETFHAVHLALFVGGRRRTRHVADDLR